MTKPMGSHRTANGGRIDRSRPLSFMFDGVTYGGFAGDTLASALLANGVHLVGRSFKYHRPRGVLTAGADEPNALVQLERGARTEPNLRATQVELYQGLVATSVNAWPSLTHDLGAVNQLLSRFFVAGFYYKTFMRPKVLWDRVYEPFLRRMAGLGRAPELPDPDIYDKMHVHCDVLVVGAGPAGLAAALAAGRTGARVILMDEQAEAGGSLLSSAESLDGKPAPDWVADALAELASLPAVRVLQRTSVFGYYDQNFLCAVERRTDHLGPGARPGLSRQRLWHVRAARVVLATGAHERPLVFADNDRPGVMQASAVATYVRRFGVRLGSRAVIFTTNDSAYDAVDALLAAGIGIAAVVDSRPDPGPRAEAARAAGVVVHAGCVVAATHGTRRITGVEVRGCEGGVLAPAGLRLSCDLLAISGGWSPAVHLFSQSQGRVRWDEAKLCFVPGEAAQAQTSAGACNGTFGLGAVLAEGLAAGASAAHLAGFGDGAVPATPAVAEVAAAPGDALWLVPGLKPLGRAGKHFVDFQNDVTAFDIRLAAREGFESVEHVKRYTTNGMATDQGKTSNVNGLAILADTLGRAIPEVGTTTFRAPYTPVTFGVMAGRDLGEMLDPVRTTPIHAWHVARGALFEDVGQWKRPWYFPLAGEDMHAAVRREAKAVRDGLGVLDASTLGKIEIRGRDAGVFLDRIYTNLFSKLGIGRCRYGLMCKEDGMVFDDGVTARLGPDHYYMTTTTGGAARVLDWLEDYLQTEWPDLEVYCTSVTEQWSTIAVSGPRARDLLADLAPGMAVDPESFPFLSMREGMVAGLAARVFRISFTGELSYEINVPSHLGLAMWQAVMAAGARHGITPYGTETMHLLRAEKGFIIIGQETDGTVTPLDLGMDWIVSKQKDFVGKRSLTRSDTARADRKRLVGLLPEDEGEVLPEGAQLVEMAGGTPPVPMLGHVTSSYWSPNLGRSFALALIKGGPERLGQIVFAPLAGGRTVKARIVEPVFLDREGSRQNG